MFYSYCLISIESHKSILRIRIVRRSAVDNFLEHEKITLQKCWRNVSVKTHQQLRHDAMRTYMTRRSLVPMIFETVP